MVLPAFSCVPAATVSFSVLKSEMLACATVCAHRSCSCVEAHGRPTDRNNPRSVAFVQQINIASACTGEHDLLFLHGDAWVNIQMLLAQQWYIDGRIAVTARQGALGPGIPSSQNRPICIATSALGDCVPQRRTHGMPGPVCLLDCAGQRWPWLQNSLHTCRLATRQVNLQECCYSWVDFLFLPRRAHARFAELANVFREVFHEVAIPTILNALVRESHGAVWSPTLDCLGGTEFHLSWEDEATRHALCAHKLDLKRMHESNVTMHCVEPRAMENRMRQPQHSDSEYGGLLRVGGTSGDSVDQTPRNTTLRGLQPSWLRASMVQSADPRDPSKLLRSPRCWT